jgi:hypothetical protein
MSLNAASGASNSGDAVPAPNVLADEYPITVIVWIRVNTGTGSGYFADIRETGGGPRYALQVNSVNVLRMTVFGTGADHLDITHSRPDEWLQVAYKALAANDREMRIYSPDGTSWTGTNTGNNTPGADLPIGWTLFGQSPDCDVARYTCYNADIPWELIASLVRGRNPADLPQYRHKLAFYLP